MDGGVADFLDGPHFGKEARFQIVFKGLLVD
jgi:hypothetical protein